ncbi:transposase [Neobacillus niacini]|nr:transposase [Neobacillus niacini]
MESTGKYWVPVYNLLEDTIHITVANPKWVKAEKEIITRADVYLKPALVQVAHAAVKSDKSSYYKTKYERIYKRRGEKELLSLLQG